MRAPGFAFVVALAACARTEPAPGGISDSALRAELRQRVAVDQAVRDTFAEQLQATGTLTPEVVQRMQAVDSTNVAWLGPYLDSAGLPTRAMVGRDGVADMLLLIQHADRDTALQAKALSLAEAAFRAGEVTGQELALLTDRVLKARGQPQRYGTQATIESGSTRFYVIEDSAGVDGRRARLGLVPLAEYKRVLDSVYGRPEGRRP